MRLPSLLASCLVAVLSSCAVDERDLAVADRPPTFPSSTDMEQVNPLTGSPPPPDDAPAQNAGGAGGSPNEGVEPGSFEVSDPDGDDPDGAEEPSNNEQPPIEPEPLPEPPDPAVLTSGASAVTQFDFGATEVGGTSSVTTWTVTNGGGSPTEVLSLSNETPDELVVVNNGCTGVLQPGVACSVDVSFRPAGPGARTGTLALFAGASTVSFRGTANGQYRLTVVNASAGATGVVRAATTSLDCGAVCSALVPAGSQLTLQARTQNGSGAFFTGWSGAGCSGSFRDCVIRVDGATTVTATFRPMVNNLIFATSTFFPTTLGSPAAYDTQCNTVATAAGLNDNAGTGYISLMSTAANLARTRLGAAARGWVRRDGTPFADTQASLFGANQVFNAIHFDENGSELEGAQYGLTGTNRDGTAAADNCSNWTSASGSLIGGNINDGPIAWVEGTSAACGPARLICMGRTRSAALARPATPGARTIWLTNNAYAVGTGQTPDQKCQSQRPAGVATARALVATTQSPASAVLAPAATYVRPDGVVVGTGAQLASGDALQSGIWQSADLVYRTIGFARVWTGQTDLTRAGSAESTCGNWTDPARTAGNTGYILTSHTQWWVLTTDPCSVEAGLYCVSTQ